jgi:poly(hydroxyalkanoate) granule-associated protein
MTEVETIEVHEDVVEHRGNALRPLVEGTHRTVLAGLGFAALAQEEAVDLFDRLVTRGEEAEEAGRKALKEAMEKRRQESEEAEVELETRMEKVLHRMNLPTQSDVRELNEQIVLLNQKIDQLKKSK